MPSPIPPDNAAQTSANDNMSDADRTLADDIRRVEALRAAADAFTQRLQRNQTGGNSREGGDVQGY